MLRKANLPSTSASVVTGPSASVISTWQRCGGASQPSTRTVPSALDSILIMIVRLLLSNVIVRLSSGAPRASVGSATLSCARS